MKPNRRTPRSAHAVRPHSIVKERFDMTELQPYAILSELEEDIIASTVPPSLLRLSPAVSPRRDSRMSRLMSSGWVAAVLSVVIAVGVIVAIVLAGHTDPDLPPVGIGGESETRPVVPPESETTPSDTTTPPESDSTPHDTAPETVPETVPATPAEENPFRYGYSIATPDGWGRGKTIRLTLFMQNISAHPILTDTETSSSGKNPYFTLSMDMGGSAAPYQVPHDWYLDDDLTHYGIARGEIVVATYALTLPEELPGGGYNLDLLVFHADGARHACLFEDALSEFGMKYPALRNGQGEQSPLRDEWIVGKEQINDAGSTIEYWPLSVEDVRERADALGHAGSALMVRGEVEADPFPVHSIAVYDEGCREVARGTDITLLNRCTPGQTYYVNLVAFEELQWDGEDEDGNWIGGSVTRLTEYLFPFVRYEQPTGTAGVRYDYAENTKTYTIAGLDADAKAAPEITVTPYRSYFPVVAVADGAFAGCAATTVTLPRSIETIGSAFTDCLNLMVIRYGGTVADWEAVSKATDWAAGAEMLTVIQCTDGKISVSPTP